MKISIEQVEKLKERTNVTYEEARDALNATDGDILEAVIMLEKEGKTSSSTAAFSTNSSLPEMTSEPVRDHTDTSNANQHANQNQNNANQGNYNSNQYNNNAGQGNYSGYQNQGQGQGQYHYQYQGQDQYTSFGDVMRKIGNGCSKILHVGNTNYLVAHRFDRETTRVPVTLLVIFLIFLFPITVTVLIVPLFFGYRYRFSGPNLERDDINNAMNKASDVAEDIKQSFSNEVNQHGGAQNSNNTAYENTANTQNYNAEPETTENEEADPKASEKASDNQ